MVDWSFLYGNVASSTEIQKTDIRLWPLENNYVKFHYLKYIFSFNTLIHSTLL